MRQLNIGLTYSLLILSLFVAACGPAPESTESETAGSIDFEQTGIEGVFAETAVDDSAANTDSNESEPTFSNDEAEQTVVVDEEANTTPTEAPPPVEQEVAEETAVATFDSYGIPIGFTEDGRPYRGNLDAPIVLEEFSDFECPFCSRFALETLPSLLQNQIINGEVLFIYHNFPLTNLHPRATAASNAVRCAGEQGIEAYWGMHDLLFANFGQWSSNNANSLFANYGNSLGLEAESFTTCLDEGRYLAAIDEELNYGRSLGVSSTPSFFLNGNMFVGAQPYSAFSEAIAILLDGGELASAQPTPDPAALPTPAPVSYDDAAFSLGDPNAPVRIVEYTDFQCPFCQRHHVQTLPQIVTNLIETGRVHYSFKDLPLENIHPEARLAHIAARCAGEQEAFLPMHDALFEQQERWSGTGINAELIFNEMATELTLDEDSFGQCLSERRYDTAVQANIDEAISFDITGTPFFLIDGYPVNGAQPYELFEFAVAHAEEGTLAEAYRTEEPQAQPTAAPPPTDIVVNLENSFAIGDPDAPITIVEFTDYQCPFCARHFIQTLPHLKANYIDEGIVYYVFKDFPLTQIHPQAFLASEAARCAGDQGEYLLMHDMLFANQQRWGHNNAADDFIGYATQLGLEAELFAECLTTRQYETAVQADLDEGLINGVRGTPAFIINGTLVSGALPTETFDQAIQYFLAEAEVESDN